MSSLPASAPVPVESQTDAVDARQRILDCTIAVINENGEAAVRMAQVARDAGVTPGLITYYFGSREHLVVEAQLARFLAMLPADVKFFSEQLTLDKTAANANAAARSMFENALSSARAEIRRRRLSALGAAIERPEMLEKLAEGQRTLIDAGEQTFSRMKKLGLLKPTVDPRGLAGFVFSLSFGSVLIDIMGDDTTRAGMSSIVQVIVDALIPAQ